jgi:hypothetical protein
MQWIAFIAGSTNLTLAIDAFNCQLGRGLEVGIYRSLDCNNFTLVSNCDTDLGNNETGIFRNTVPLIVGQYYYLVMDGSGDDVCNYRVRVTNGTTLVPPLTESGNIIGAVSVCAAQTVRYALQFPKGATAFEWQLDGQPIGKDSVVSVTWNTPGEHSLCAIASNACDTAPPVCQTVRVLPLAKTVVTRNVCTGSCVTEQDSLLCKAGIYRFTYTGWKGCDSLVEVQVREVSQVTTALRLTICTGDSVVSGGRGYYRTGQYEIALKTATGCDSTVQLELKTIVCNMKGNMETTDARCAKGADGSFRFQVTDGTPPFNYVWSRVGHLSPAGAGTLAQLAAPVSIGNLPAGTYFVSITDQFGNQLIVAKEVKEPDSLHIGLQHPLTKGFALRCAGDRNGTISAFVQGGTAPYRYLWNTGDTSRQLDNRAAGLYLLRVTDAGGCTAQAVDTLNAPPPLRMDAVFTNAGCDNENSGRITVVGRGGAGPYQYILNNQNVGPTSAFERLPPGRYTLVIRDANGCTADTSSVLVQPLIPTVLAGAFLYTDLGDPVTLQPQAALAAVWQWTPPDGLSCADCRNPVALPLRTTQWTLTVTSPTGCSRSDSLIVRVRDRRRVYFPNVFRPTDENGENTVFYISAGSEVLKINSLRVYSRWGELVFGRENFAPNLPAQGWDGRWRGETVGAGLFVWQAEVEFIDGVRQQYKGDVLVVR